MEEEEEPPLASLPPTRAHPHSQEPQNRTYTTAYTEGEGIDQVLLLPTFAVPICRVNWRAATQDTGFLYCFEPSKVALQQGTRGKNKERDVKEEYEYTYKLQEANQSRFSPLFRTVFAKTIFHLLNYVFISQSPAFRRFDNARYSRWAPLHDAKSPKFGFRQVR
jgi:hypothetical protein